jgi:hypothetical protein
VRRMHSMELALSCGAAPLRTSAMDVAGSVVVVLVLQLVGRIRSSAMSECIWSSGPLLHIGYMHLMRMYLHILHATPRRPLPRLAVVPVE